MPQVLGQKILSDAAQFNCVHLQSPRGTPLGCPGLGSLKGGGKEVVVSQI